MFKKNYPLEGWLRYPVEVFSMVILCLAILLLVMHPRLFLLTPIIQDVLIGLLLVLLIRRVLQVYRIVRYQHQLKQLPDYRVSSSNLPNRAGQLFLGKGFRWQAIHTQRLSDVKHYDSRKKSKRYNQHKQHQLLGGLSALHGVALHERAVFTPLSERVGHTLVLGTTRVGKTRLLEILATQDIHRGEVVIVFDPKGDVALLKRLVFECEQSNRLADLMVFHLGFPSISARYNPIGQFARITEVANRVANQLPNSGESAAFREFAWRFVNIIAGALVALEIKPNYRLLNAYILNIDPLLYAYAEKILPAINPSWQHEVDKQLHKIDDRKLPFHLKNRSYRMIALVRYVESLSLNDDVLKGLLAIFNYDKTYYQKITASLSPLLEKLTTGEVADLISPKINEHDQREIFDWQQVIREKKVVYVGLDALSDMTVATAVGNSMFADLCSVAGQLYKFGVDEKNTSKTFHPINLHADEFNELIGEEFVPLLNKAGGAGMRVTAYTQTIPDIEARLGNAAKTGQVLGNLNSIICLRVLDEATAHFFVNKLSQRVPIKRLARSTNVGDANASQETTHFNTQQSDQIQVTERPMLGASDLHQLPKGQAFCLLQGGQLWKIRIPLPVDEMQAWPDHIEVLMQAVRAKLNKIPVVIGDEND